MKDVQKEDTNCFSLVSLSTWKKTLMDIFVRYFLYCQDNAISVMVKHTSITSHLIRERCGVLIDALDTNQWQSCEVSQWVLEPLLCVILCFLIYYYLFVDLYSLVLFCVLNCCFVFPSLNFFSEMLFWTPEPWEFGDWLIESSARLQLNVEVDHCSVSISFTRPARLMQSPFHMTPGLRSAGTTAKKGQTVSSSSRPLLLQT